MRHARLSPSAIALGLSALVLIAPAAGCGEAPPAPNPAAAQAEENARAIAELRASLDALAKDVRRQSRQRAGLERATAARPRDEGGGHADVGGPGAEAGSAAPASAAEDADQTILDAATARAVLESDAGRAAIEKAASREIARREEEERRTFVSYTIGMFAQRAGLAERETAELQRIWKESLDSGAKLRKRFAALGELPDEQRAVAREKAMDFMRGIGRERNERVQALLSAQQYELYGEAEDEILSAMHGGSRRPPAQSGNGREE